MVAVDRKVQLCLWKYSPSRQVGVIVRLLYAGKFSCVSGSIVDRWMLL